jgi:hypothetical protein
MCAHDSPLCQAFEKVEIPRPKRVDPNRNNEAEQDNNNNSDRIIMKHKQEQHRELIEWIRSHPRGFVNDKLEIRQADMNDPSLGSGMFVNGAIQKGQLLYSIPWDLIIKPHEDEYNGNFSDDEPILSCETVTSLIQELNLGNESKFGPYLQYFHDFKSNYLMDHWSESGIDLINYIVGYDMKEDNSLLNYWDETCGGSSSFLHEKAALYVMTRAEDYFLIPLFDLANHQNGQMNHAHKVNKKIEIFKGISADGIATRDISAGEEIVHPYHVYEKRKDDFYCTTTLMHHFGFVESMPQRWVFENYLVDNQYVVFDLDYKTSDTGQEEEDLEVKWLHDWYWPDQDTLQFLQEEGERLDEISANLETHDSWRVLSSMSEDEYNVASRYHEARVVAVRTAILATKETILDTEEELGTWDSRSEEDACDDDFFCDL